LNIKQVEWRGKPAIAIAYTTDRQQAINILAFIIFGATLGLCMALMQVYGVFALIPIPIAGIFAADALRQRMFILMDAKRRFLTGVRKGFILTKEIFSIQVVQVLEITVEDSTANITRVIGPEVGKQGGTRKFHVIAKGRGGNFLVASTSNERNATLIAYAVSRAINRRLGGRVNLSHWKEYIEILEEEEKDVLEGLISDRGRALQ
jgi:hypothetical protein